jgi:hypothetical protein
MMSKPTRHGENIANDIQTEDAYGAFNPLTLADIWLIVDNLHTHMLDNGGNDETMRLLEGWMRQLEAMDSELPPA